MRERRVVQHAQDPRQTLLLENAYYQVCTSLQSRHFSHLFQCNPPERGPREEKQRPPMVLFVRHLIYDLLSKKTIDKVLKLLRKLDWNNPQVRCSIYSLTSVLTTLPDLSGNLQRVHQTLESQVQQHLINGDACL